jgi:glutamate formiminotransferase
MTAPLVECVPNFSEGRDRATIDALRSTITGVGGGVQLLDVQSDAAHNRSVFTFVAPPGAAVDAAFAAMRVAAQRIDLTKHSGEHPRMGATDVVPFVPVAGITMDECVALARTLGERVGKELEIPVFLYARAATRPERVLLPDVRKGEFEGMRDRTLEPDFGPNRVHPTAGATAIGARPFLVAYNVYLDTPDVSIAKDIAKQIRTSSGGLPAVQASGFEVEGLAQISMNLSHDGLRGDQGPGGQARRGGEEERNRGSDSGTRDHQCGRRVTPTAGCRRSHSRGEDSRGAERAVARWLD